MIVRNVCLAAQNTAESLDRAHAAFLDETLFVLLKAVSNSTEPERTASDMATNVVARAVRQGRERDIEMSMDSLQEEGEALLAQALNVPATDHAVFYDLLYAAVPALRGCHQIGRYVTALHEEFPAIGSPSLLRYVERARHAVEEKIIRIQDSLSEDAEDILGKSLAHHRQQVMQEVGDQGCRMQQHWKQRSLPLMVCCILGA